MPARERLQYRRVQRPTGELPVLHVETAVPSPERWQIEVRGMVEVAAVWDLEEIRAMRTEERVWDLHCVWGWSRPSCRWEGIPAATLIDEARPKAAARYAVAHTVEGPYASCLTVEEARASLIAWKLDGEELSPEHGGPLRLVTPPNKWGYKGIKWLGSIALSDQFTPGFWEELVGNPRGDVPDEMLDLEIE